jgi:hypothetical protein
MVIPTIEVLVCGTVKVMPEGPKIQASPQLQFWPLAEGISVHERKRIMNEALCSISLG